MPIHVRFNWFEKAASILHLYLPWLGGCHYRTAWSATWTCCHNTTCCPVPISCCAKPAYCIVCGCGAFSSYNSSINPRVVSTIVALSSFTSSQPLRFMCFHIRQKTEANLCLWTFDRVCRREKMVVAIVSLCIVACFTFYQSLSMFQTFIAKGHLNNRCCRSSWLKLQLLHLVGNETPLSCNLTKVGKHPLHIRQTKFLTFGRTLRHQISCQFPVRWRWET